MSSFFSTQFALVTEAIYFFTLTKESLKLTLGENNNDFFSYILIFFTNTFHNRIIMTILKFAQVAQVLSICTILLKYRKKMRKILLFSFGEDFNLSFKNRCQGFFKNFSYRTHGT